MRVLLAVLWVLAAATLLGSKGSTAARVLSQSSVDLPFVNWPTLLGPTITDENSARNYCAQVGLKCTELLIGEMRRRYNALKGTCDHNAVFSLLYLRVTEGFYNVTAAQPNYWQDANFVIWYSFYFATFYLKARDNYAAGQPVAQPWQLAFQSADQEKTTGTGDLLLGVNAHVNHDLAFALAHVGLTAPDGSSRKPDHDKVNDVLRAVGNPSTMELGCRLDPSISASNIPNTTIDDDGIVYLLITWREQAWRNAERLVAATSGQSLETYDQVVASINANSVVQAQTYIATNSYITVAGVPVGGSATVRDAYCALHKDDVSCAQNYGY